MVHLHIESRTGVRLEEMGLRDRLKRCCKFGEVRVEHIPILKVGDLLLVSIQVDMHDRLAMTLQNDLTDRIVQAKAKGVLLDISSLEIIDSFIGRIIGNIAAMARLLDVDTVVVGMQPAVAITLVELGLALPGVSTALNVENGIALLQSACAQRGRRNGSVKV